MPSEIQTAFLLKGFSSTALHKGGFLCRLKALQTALVYTAGVPPPLSRRGCQGCLIFKSPLERTGAQL
ncbi:hypothetical protein HKO24_04865 [Neisseria meningitidis]|nr:hypothetical protein [Neisseria meningitidis]